MAGLIELDGFSEAVRRHVERSQCLAVVPYDGVRVCSRCGVGQVARMSAGVQTALFRHGGFGEAVERTVDVCLACGRVVVAGFATLRWL